MAEHLRRRHEQGYDVVIVSGRPVDRLEETRAWLDENAIPYEEIHLSDFPAGPNSARAFKVYKARLLLQEYQIFEWLENDAQTREELAALGINTLPPSRVGKATTAAGKALDVPAYVADNATRGLDYYEQGFGGDGLVEATIRDARDMAAGTVSEDKVRRIGPWIARHLVDLDAPQNSNPDDPDYPGPGLVAMLLWGGGPDRAGALRTQAWAERETARLDA